MSLKQTTEQSESVKPRTIKRPRITHMRMERFHVSQLNEDDVWWLRQMLKYDVYDTPLGNVLARIDSGHLAAYRISGAQVAGILLTQLLQQDNGREFVVWGLAGRGLAKAGAELAQMVKYEATTNMCKWISTYTKRRGLQHLIEKHLGPTTVVYKTVKEL